ncbi:MAG TPA: hypothetical protein VGC82_21365, partial [Rhodopila sp.]
VRSRSTAAEAEGAWATVIPSLLQGAFGPPDGGGANKEDFSGGAAGAGILPMTPPSGALD